MIGVGNFFFAHRNAVFPLLALLVFLPGPPIFPDALDALAVGALLAVCGQALRFTTIGLRYIVRGGRDRRVYADALVTEGIYRHCRNPMYVGNLVILSGVALASNSWSCVAVAVPLFAFIYDAMVTAEEHFLKGKFGAQYDVYLREVPRWWPRLRNAGETFAGANFHWRRALAKEYGTPFGWICGLCAIGYVNLWRANELVTRRPAVGALAAIAGSTLLAWAIVRSLKKSRYLVAD
jgi:protein-S-isoprenylcysteine O-methyltransferase Ste14